MRLKRRTIAGVTNFRALLNSVEDLISSGHYRDEVPGLPGVALAGAGALRGDRRLYYRGTEEFAAAAAQGLLDRLPPPPQPASRPAIEEAESLVGAPLPDLLKSLYALANGGFGPDRLGCGTGSPMTCTGRP
jgi:hypothetical protein